MSAPAPINCSAWQIALERRHERPAPTRSIPAGASVASALSSVTFGPIGTPAASAIELKRSGQAALCDILWMADWVTDWRGRLRCVAEAVLRRGSREVLFLVSVWLKGLDGLLELIGGIALFSVSPAFILHIVRLLTQDEIAEDPRDLIANALRHAAGHLTFATEHFMAMYLLIHGVVKFALVWALLARVLIAYPLSIVIFAGFMIYQLYRYSFTHGIGLLALSAFDIVVIGLVWVEYRALRRRRVGVPGA